MSASAGWGVICDTFVSRWPDPKTARQHADDCNKGLLPNKCPNLHVAAVTDLPYGPRR